MLIRTGDSSERVYNVESGLLLASRMGSDGGRQILGFVFPDNLLGLTAGDQYSFSVHAVLETRVRWTTRQSLDVLIDRDPESRRAFVRMLYRVLDRYQDLVFSLGQRTATERLAVFLLFLRYQGLRSSSPWAKPTELDLPVGRNEMADFLGLKTETISRSLRALEMAGLIVRVTPSNIQFMDLEGLRDLAGSQDLTSPKA